MSNGPGAPRTVHPKNLTWAEEIRSRQESLATGLQHPSDLADVFVGDVQVHVHKNVVQDDEI